MRARPYAPVSSDAAMALGRRSTDRGQALVETALTLPLTVFLVLGALQLFLLFQGRAMAQYAAARSTRAGSLNSGKCSAMVHSAVAVLLPTFTPTRTPIELADAFARHFDAHYVPAENAGHDETIVWVIRERPRGVTRQDEEDFDLASSTPTTLAVRLVFWYPMRIPFANWVINTITRARFGLSNLKGVNPLLVTQGHADWSGTTSVQPAIAAELTQRAAKAHYVMPIEVTYSMRMMTPPRPIHFAAAPCAPFP